MGKDTWARSLKCLQRWGIFVNFGQSSGMITRFSLTDLARGGDLFARLTSGGLQKQVPHCHPLQEAGKAHADLEGRRTTPATVLLT